MGFLDGLRNTAKNVTKSVSNVSNNARNAAADFSTDPTGLKRLSEREDVQEIRRDYEESDSVFGKFGAAVQAGTEAALDNPSFSVQDVTRGALARGTGRDSEELGQNVQSAFDTAGQSWESATDDGPLDNPATDAVGWAGSAIVGEWASSAIGATTGIDTESGSTDARTGAMDIFNIGGGVGLGGAGRAVGRTAAARSADDVLGSIGRSAADEGGSVLSRVTRSASDDAASVASRSVDESTQSFSSITDDLLPAASRQSDEGATSLRSVLDSAGSSRTFTASDEVIDIGEATSRTVRGAGSVTDDAASAAARSTDEGTSLVSRIRQRAATGGDDLFRIGDDAASAASRAGSRAASSPLAKWSAAGAGVTAAGAGLASLGMFSQGDSMEIGDKILTYEKDYAPNQKHPEGGTLWRVTRGGSMEGYTIVTRVRGNAVYIVDGAGQESLSLVTATDFENAIAKRGVQ